MGFAGIALLYHSNFDPSGCAFALSSGKRKLRSLFWRVRAEFQRQLKINAGFSSSSHLHPLHHHTKKKKRRLSFNYDPFSYSLNFDDGDFGFLC
ncbi:hypothetical protein Nepgr_000771 [Nepenthes gracilis]|uniref:Uncharacterized protein n=1 Tax=Nepenthes gracilis TaxID=150966 RepID=A0AAD3P494_NEPGR|nr:hypothetical protein Nepgr_000771 [Nepenthes gracilis]